MIKLDEHIGEKIFICPKHPLNPEDSGQKTYSVKLVGVDSGGIWFEHEDATRRLFSDMRAEGYPVSPDVPKILAFFLPYSELYFAWLVATTIDERSLGV